MDDGTLRGLATLVLMIAFIGIVFWAWSKRRKADFEKLARMPLEEDPPRKDQGSNTP
jgi:cytochrome c oxidase cbb3-type subunit 4